MAIVRNAVKCLDCSVEIESTHVHDWKQCDCGNVFVDGGKDYIRRGFVNAERYVEMSVFTDDEEAPAPAGDQWTTSETGL